VRTSVDDLVPGVDERRQEHGSDLPSTSVQGDPHAK
jgi:hypothetical protein